MEPSEQSEANNITLVDLKNMLVVIDLATQRGALRGPELRSVADLYEKINLFVSATEKKLKDERPNDV